MGKNNKPEPVKMVWVEALKTKTNTRNFIKGNRFEVTEATSEILTKAGLAKVVDGPKTEGNESQQPKVAPKKK